jgi:hypothetical protein
VVIEPGGRGQFDVFHAGELIASKNEVGLLRQLFGAGSAFPDEESVVEALARRTSAG